MNRVTAPMSPDTAARGPDERGEIHWRAHPMRERAEDRGHGHEDEKPHRPEAAGDRRTEGDEPNGVEQDMRPRAVKEGVSQQRPWFGAAAQRTKISHCARLLEGGRVGVGPDEQVDCARRPEGDRQPARHESEVADDEILDRRARPGKRREDRNEQDGENDDDPGRVEHRLPPRRRVRRFSSIHARPCLSIGLALEGNCDRSQAGTGDGRRRPSNVAPRERGPSQSTRLVIVNSMSLGKVRHAACPARGTACSLHRSRRPGAAASPRSFVKQPQPDRRG